MSGALTTRTLTVFVSTVKASTEERIYRCPYTTVPKGISLLLVSGVLTWVFNPDGVGNQ